MTTDLKELAVRVLAGAGGAVSGRGATGACGASGARGSSGAPHAAIVGRLMLLARSLGIPRAIVDSLSPEELEATAEQAALCEGYPDANGDSLPTTILTLYLKHLANLVEKEARTVGVSADYTHEIPQNEAFQSERCALPHTRPHAGRSR